MENENLVSEDKISKNINLFSRCFVFCLYSEMDREAEKKRLSISTHHKTTDGCSEFLGCMSFGVKHLLSKGKVGGFVNKKMLQLRTHVIH